MKTATPPITSLLSQKPPITPITLLEEFKKPCLSLKLDRQVADHKGNAADHSLVEVW
jgi:hypothetical protein